MARKSKKKQEQSSQSHNGPSSSPQPVPMAPLADMRSDRTDMSAAGVAAEAQQLADQTMADATDAAISEGFNMFDTPHVSAAKAVSEMRARHEVDFPPRRELNGDDVSEMASQATEGLLQLANATQAMKGLHDATGKRQFAADHAGSDGAYARMNMADDPTAEFLHTRDDAYQPADPDYNSVPEAAASKKRKRAAGKQAGSNKRHQAANGGDAEVTANVVTDEFPSAGPFTNSEKAIVERFADGFREENRLAPEALNSLVQNKDRKMDDITRSFWSQIYQLLDNRDNKAMQRHVRRRFHNFTVRGKWSGEDDESLKRAFEQKPNQWTAIGEMLQRMPEDCRDRWRNYVVCGTNRKTDQWDPQEEEDLSMAVHECIAIVKNEARNKAKEERLAFREDQDWEALVNFNIVSEKLGHTRSRIQCLQHWKAMNIRDQQGRTKRRMKRAPGEAPPKRRNGKGEGTPRSNYMAMLVGDKHTILREILESDAYEEANVNWPLMAQRSALRRWSGTDRKYAWGRIKKMLELGDSLSFREKVDQALEHFENNHAGDLEKFFDPQAPSTAPDPAEDLPSGDADEENGDESNIHPELRGPDASATDDSPAKPKKKRKGRGPGKKPRKSAKNFKSADRIDEEEATAQQQAAPQAKMSSSASGIPPNPYEVPQQTVNRLYSKSARDGEQDDEESEPELPPHRRDDDDDDDDDDDGEDDEDDVE